MATNKLPAPTLPQKMTIWYTVPPGHCVIILRFGREVGKPKYMGLHFKLPFIDWALVLSLQLVTTEFEVDFTTKDGMGIVGKISLQWSPDPSCKKKSGNLLGQTTFLTVSPQDIVSGLTAEVSRIIHAFGGLMEGKALVEQQNEVQLMVDATLRLGIPPHVTHDVASCDVSGCDETKVSQDRLLQFYHDHEVQMRQTITSQASAPNETSSVEETYGIEITSCALKDLDFSPETKRAMEEERQAEMRQKPMEIIRQEAKKNITELGVLPDTALSTAAHVVGGSPRQVIAVEGGSIADAALAGLASKVMNWQDLHGKGGDK